MNEKKMKKLKLSRETLSMLNSSDLAAVQGGAAGLVLMTHEPPTTRLALMTHEPPTTK